MAAHVEGGMTWRQSTGRVGNGHWNDVRTMCLMLARCMETVICMCVELVGALGMCRSRDCVMSVAIATRQYNYIYIYIYICNLRCIKST